MLYVLVKPHKSKISTPLIVLPMLTPPICL